MEEKKWSSLTIGEIVADDFRTASVFTAAGIDFCCGGKKTLEQACSETNVNQDVIIQKLSESKETGSDSGMNFKEWDLPFLIDYIVNKHHRYVLKSLPELVFYTGKIANVHGIRHPELSEIAHLFSKINEELLQHLKDEEGVLFPAIKSVYKGDSPELKGIIESEISRMNGEHEFAGGAMDKINVISSGYLVPDDGCNTYQLTFKLLKQFEDDLHVHVHIENNILFPKALNL